jgi:copper transport protein
VVSARARRALTALVAGAAVALLAPAGALAHAELEGVSPQRGAVVVAQPSQVTFRFGEAVEGTFGAVRVFARTGGRVDAGDAFHPAGQGRRIAVHLKRSLPDGTYTATYRVVSVDGHVVSGGSTFSIGKASGPGATVADLLAGSDTGPVTTTTLNVFKGLTFGAVAVLVGGLGFLLWTWSASSELATADAGAALLGRLRRLLAGAALVGALGAAGEVVLEGANAAGISGWSALSSGVVRDTLSTRTGAIWGAAVPVWLAVAALSAVVLAPRRRGPSHAAAALLGAGTVFLVLVPGLGGHAATQHPVWLLLPANTLHIAAMGLWVGGLVALVAVLPAGTRRLPTAARTQLLAAVLSRFSPLALGAVGALVVGGLTQAIVEVRTPAHLLDTAFGRAVLIKAVLLGGVVAIGAWHRRTSIPRLREIARTGGATGAMGVAVRRALRGEVALLAVVLGVTAALSSYAPSIAQTASGPFSQTVRLGPAQLQVDVDPATVGSNDVHLYLMDPRDGSQWDRAKEVQLSVQQAAKGIGPLEEPMSKAGPGHYVASAGALMGVSGAWTMRIAVRVSAFDQYETTMEVPIR